ncbi:uncharacterized protein TRUGW13939_07019 [Talaromyces rugulosus]|uniref:Uncharacterized protein n=1 Tax=Talaromyces rugulosus TaxID=121627 RepID=A0A7H8R108_TALRU|nr:uncharacterized protein TRUGW13939_07019 [Talaromyces rugulosus]QKX59877.1 hypothetical protein TRUGW13939_07019 [Talaromyces rugulosus]
MYNFAYYGSLSMFRLLLDHSPEYAYLPDEERVAPVCIAARQGHAELVRLLVDECKVSVNVTCKHFNNTTPLHHATAGGNIGIVRILLQNGANPDARGGDLNASPLCIAAHIRSYPIVKLLIENGADVNVADNGGLFPLHHAAHNGHMEMVSLLLKHGAKVDPHENNRKSPLWLAAQFEKTEIVRVLLENGANPETTDIKFARRPLHQAALGGHLEIASMLLKEKVEVDAVDGGGCTPLLLAAHKGHLELVKMLLEAEANVNLAENYGTNALWIAAQLGFTKIVKVLLSYNSFVSSAGPSKRYPIHQAAQNGHLEVVKLLVEYDPGCVNCQDEQGSTPLDISTMGNNPDNRAIMDYLCGFWCLT